MALEEQTGYTAAVPSSFLGEASRRGTVEPLHYQSEDYVRGSPPVTKTAYVYLPYGYDGSARYEVLYLMHGWGGHAGEFFEYGNVVDIIDNMIEQGVIEPLIVVSPSFYNSNSSTDFSPSVDELRHFHKDFRDHLMPAVDRPRRGTPPRPFCGSEGAGWKPTGRSMPHAAVRVRRQAALAFSQGVCRDYKPPSSSRCLLRILPRPP